MCVFRGRIHTHRVPPQWFAHEITLIYDSLAVEHVGLSQVRSIQVNVLHFPSKFSLHLHRSLFLILIFFSFPSSNLVKFFSFVFFIQFSRELQFLILCIKKFKYFDSCNSNFFVYWEYESSMSWWKLRPRWKLIWENWQREFCFLFIPFDLKIKRVLEKMKRKNFSKRGSHAISRSWCKLLCRVSI